MFTSACACMGPQNGEPLCPCQMRAAREHGGGQDTVWGPLPNYTQQEPLKSLLERAKSHVMTPKELYEQRVSWLMGMTGKLSDPMPTREQVVKALEVMGVVDPEPSTPTRETSNG